MNYLVYLKSTILFIFILCFVGLMINFAFEKKVIKTKAIGIMFVLGIISFITVFCYERFSVPILKLYGKEIVTIKLNEKYNEEGYKILHPNYNLYNKVFVTTNLDNTTPGIYDMNYSIYYFNKKITKTRKIKVIDDVKPVIELIKGDIIIYGDDVYEEPGFIAADNYDGDITSLVKTTNNIKKEIGDYEVIYTVTDSSGNAFTTTRKVSIQKKETGVVMLTFDDGPSFNTAKILDVLKEENIKATFFLINFSDSYVPIIKRMHEEGHTIALHSYTHNYKIIYSSIDAYFEDLNKLSDKIKNLVGIEPKIIRFPGGSSNTVSYFNKGIMSSLTKEVKERGYHYFDWNVDASDAGGAKNSTEVYNNVIKGIKPNRNNVVLMHDTKSTTASAIKDIIEITKKKGYKFERITYETPMVAHGIRN